MNQQQIVDVVDEVKHPSTLDVALGGKVVAGLCIDGAELDLQRRARSTSSSLVRNLTPENLSNGG